MILLSRRDELSDLCPTAEFFLLSSSKRIEVIRKSEYGRDCPKKLFFSAKILKFFFSFTLYYHIPFL